MGHISEASQKELKGSHEKSWIPVSHSYEASQKELKVRNNFLPLKKVKRKKHPRRN